DVAIALAPLPRRRRERRDAMQAVVVLVGVELGLEGHASILGCRAVERHEGGPTILPVKAPWEKFSLPAADGSVYATGRSPEFVRTMLEIFGSLVARVTKLP